MKKEKIPNFFLFYIHKLYYFVKPLSHRDSGKYTGNVFRHLFPDR